MTFAIRTTALTAAAGMWLLLSSQPTGVVAGRTDYYLAAQVGGASNAVAVDGRNVYLGVGARLLVFDATMPTMPRPIGESPILGGVVQKVEVARAYAFVAVTPHLGTLSTLVSEVHILDLQLPATPREVAVVEVPGVIADLAIQGETLYVAATGGGLKIVDIKVPSSAQIIGEFITDGDVDSVAARDGTVYLANWLYGLQIVDVSNPRTPHLVSTLAITGLAQEVIVKDGSLYLVSANRASGAGLIDVYSLREPRHPQRIGSVSVSASIDSITLEGRRLVTLEGGRLSVFDVSEQGDPMLLGRQAWPGLAHDVAVADGFAYVASEIGISSTAVYPAGLRVVDFRDPSNLQRGGRFGTLRWAGAVAAAEDSILLGARIGDSQELRVINMPTSSTIEPTVQGDTLGRIWDIEYSDGLAYVGAWDFDVAFAGGGLRIIDLANRETPTVIGRLDVNGAARGLFKSESIIYLASDDGLYIVDVSNNEEPKLLGHFSTETATNGVDVEVVGTFAFLTLEDLSGGRLGGALLVVDVANPSKPTYVAEYDLGMRPLRSVHASGKLYVAGSGGLRIVDISNPVDPRVVGSISVRGTGADVTLDGTTGYLAVDEHAGGSGYIAVLDVSGLPGPSLLSEIRLPAAPSSIQFDRRRLLVGCASGGFVIVEEDFRVVATPTATVELRATPTATQAPVIRRQLFLPHAQIPGS